jgi:hypothetical protein
LGQAAAGPAHVRRAGDDAEAPRQQLLHDALAGAPGRAGHEDGHPLLLGGCGAPRRRVNGGGGAAAEEELPRARGGREDKSGRQVGAGGRGADDAGHFSVAEPRRRGLLG